jgi:hypothetical protein
MGNYVKQEKQQTYFEKKTVKLEVQLGKERKKREFCGKRLENVSIERKCCVEANELKYCELF